MNKDKINQLSFEEKKRLFTEIRKKKLSINPKHSIEIGQYPRNIPIPTSVIQQEIWFYEKLVENSNAYNIPIAMEVTGELNYTALTQAFQIVIDRYEILRTSFYTKEGIPHQRIEDSLDFKLNIINLEQESLELKDKLVLDLLFDFAKQNFILENAPLFRVLCLELHPKVTVLSFVIHHLLCDNWSLTLLIQEILDLFYQISNDKSVEVVKPKFQYADYCFWEKELLSSSETQNKIEFLKNKTRSLNFELKLPYDYSRDFNVRTSAKSKQFVLDPECTRKIRVLCQANELSSYIFFLTAYHALLYKYTFQSEIVIGTSFLSRPANEENGIMGPFINVAFIDSKLTSDITFATLANQIKATVLEMHGYRFIPLNKMLKSRESQNPKETSLIKVFFGFLSFKVNQVAASSSMNLSVKLLNQSNEFRVYNTAKFELDLTAWEDNHQMGGSLEYMSNIFKDETIDLLIEHYQYICHMMADHFHLQLQKIKLPSSVQNPLSETHASFMFE